MLVSVICMEVVTDAGFPDLPLVCAAEHIVSDSPSEPESRGPPGKICGLRR